MDIYSKFIGNFMRAKAAMELAKQGRPVFAKFLEVSCAKWQLVVMKTWKFYECWKHSHPICSQEPDMCLSE